MKRTMVDLPDDIAALLEAERRRRDITAAELIRQALVSYLARGQETPSPLRFFGAGSGQGDVARHIESILEREWGGDDLADSRSR